MLLLKLMSPEVPNLSTFFCLEVGLFFFTLEFIERIARNIWHLREARLFLHYLTCFCPFGLLVEMGFQPILKDVLNLLAFLFCDSLLF